MKIDPIKSDALERFSERQALREMAEKHAIDQMPTDLRATAKRWGLENFMALVWWSAFQAGYTEATKDREAEHING